MVLLKQDQFDQRVLDLINQHRTQNGLQALTLSQELDQAADKYADRMATGDFFSHDDPNGSTPFTRMIAEGYNYTWAGENIAVGYTSPESVVQGWMNSPGHRANILNANFTHMGLGYAYLANDTGTVNYNHYWVQKFGAGDPSPGVYVAETDSTDVKQNPSVTDVKQNPSVYMGRIRDYDGNDLGSGSSWRFVGDADVQGDGDSESVFVNSSNGRWATVGSVNGTVDFNKNGFGGDTRVVGIYIDPTLKDKPQNIGGPFDSQRRFQNDLRINNLSVLAAADYNKDGFQDMYFKLGDGTAVLRALMHLDGNIQYANYQSEADLTAFMTANNVSSSIWGSWL